jgi:hypothetical protein
MGMLLAAFVAGSFVASPELRAFAANTIGSADIINNSIQSVDIKDAEVKTSDLGADAITTAKVKDGEIKSADIANAAVQTADIGSNAVNSAKIKDGEVMTNDIANDAVTSDKLADNVFDDLQARIDALTTENAAQQVEIDDLTARVEAIEDGVLPDTFEPNDSSATAVFIGETSEAITAPPIRINANMHTTSDSDWYTANANEVSLANNNIDAFVRLTGIPAGSNYDLFVSCSAPCDSDPVSSTQAGNTDEAVSVVAFDDFGDEDDSIVLTIEVRNVGATVSPIQYTLTITVD